MSCTNHRQILVSVLALTLIATVANPAFAGDREKHDGRKAAHEATRFEKVASAAQTNSDVPTVALILELDVPYSIDEILDERTREAAEKRIAEAQRTLLGDLARGGSLVRSQTYAVVPMVAVTVDAQKAADLERHPLVRTVFEDRTLRPHLADSVPLVNAPNAWINWGATGAGQTIAVLDSGVDGTHPALSGKIVSEACYSTTNIPLGFQSLCPNGAFGGITMVGSGQPCTGVPNCDHGTHVAGIAAGNGPTVVGVAPGADIIAIQVFSADTSDNSLSAFDSDLIAALERVFELSDDFDIAAVNMSLGGGQFTGSCNGEPEAAIIDLLRQSGIATVASAGNSDFDDSIASPACVSSAVSVGATNNFDEIWQNSSSGTGSNSSIELDLLAPGVGIVSATTGGGTRAKTGTSMAAPHVAGAMAILRSEVPELSVSDLEYLLKASGVPVTDPKNGLVVPRILLDMQAASLRPLVNLMNASNTLLDRLAVLVADDRYELSGEYFQEYLDELIQEIQIMIDCHEITPGAGC